MRQPPPSTLGRAVQVMTPARHQPVACVIVAVGARDCAAQMPDGAIVRGARIVGPRPSTGDAAWLTFDEAGPFVQIAGDAGEAGGGVTLIGGGVIQSGVSQHGLADTNMHTGTLADAQAPQFAKIDGSREFTGTTIPFNAAGGVRLLFRNATTGKSCSITIDGDTFVFDGKISAPFLEAALVDAVEILADRLRALGVEGRSIRAMGSGSTSGFIEMMVEGDKGRIYTDRTNLYINRSITTG